MTIRVVNGWKLYAHPVYSAQFEGLKQDVRSAKAKNTPNWQNSAKAKTLARIENLILNIIPADPTRQDFRQGHTLGPEYKHWFRAKFGGGRFRLFFRYNSTAKIIIYAWVNDEDTLRTYGAKTDAYAVFRRMLGSGNPPDDWASLLKAPSGLTN